LADLVSRKAVGRRRKRRPGKKWINSVEEDLKKMGVEIGKW
jgi:hypothetical protein